ncbi:MAG TPA: protein kinase [Gammaproteobacteria bacterium]
MLGENTALSDKPSATPGRVPEVLCERFVLGERLEQGRLGTMYRALDRMRAMDGRAHVAVLILPAEIARNAVQLADFERELEVVRTLSHPNIVRIFSLERDGDIAFVVLEWVDGESLRSVIQSLLPETVCEADALGVVRAVGNALVYAHARGVVHGDIRPENVLVTERGEVRVLFTSACLARTAPFTIGPRDDVRGLAALAYELMAGAPPPIGGLYPADDDEPEPIEGLSRKRWKALKSALSMRDGRVSSVKRLLAALDLPEPRAPRRGSRPDRVRDARRGGFKRLAIAAAFGAGVAVLAVGGFRGWIGAGGSLPESVESGASRAADLTREGLSGARARLDRAGSALSALWSEVGERIDAAAVARRDAASGRESAPDAEDGAVAETELFDRERLNGTGDDAAADDRDAAGDETAAPSAAGEAPTAAGDASSSAAEPSDSAADAPSTAGEAPGSDARSPDEASVSADEASPAGEASSAEQVAAAPRAEAPETRPAAETGPADDAQASVDDEPTARPEPASAAPASEPTPAADRDAAGPPPAPRVRFSRSEYVVSESEGVAAVQVERSDARGDVSFVWWTSDGSATSGDDYGDFGRRVERLRDGERATVLYVPITSDSIVEPQQEDFEIHVGVLSPEGNQDGALESARVTIVDDDR